MEKELFTRYEHWATQHIRPSVIKRDSSKEFDFKLWQELAQTGFFRLLVPKKLGGLGANVIDFVHAFSGLAKGALDIPFVLSAGAHGGIGISLFLKFANDQQKRRYLERMMRGDCIAALCNSESGAGTDLKSMRSTVKMSDREWGTATISKAAANNLSIADLAIVSAWKLETGRDPSLDVFLIDCGAQVEQKPLELAGFWTGDVGSLSARNLRISKRRHQLGSDRSGFIVLKQCYDLERFLIPVFIAGTLEGMLDEALAHIQERKSFGKHIGEYQYVQDKVVTIYQASQTVRGTLASLLEGRTEEQKSEFPSETAALSSAKITAVEQGYVSATAFFELFGTLGYQNNHLAQKLVRDFLALKCLGGTKEQHKLTLFSEVMKFYQEQYSNETAVNE